MSMCNPNYTKAKYEITASHCRMIPDLQRHIRFD